jgi:hypothetical protein
MPDMPRTMAIAMVGPLTNFGIPLPDPSKQAAATA